MRHGWWAVVAVVVVALGVWLAFHARREIVPVGARTEPPIAPAATSATDGFPQWLAAHKTGRDAPPVSQGIMLARQRRTELQELIQTDPARALAAAVPPEQRVALPVEVQAELEQWITGRGFYGVRVADFEGGRHETRRVVRLGGKEYQAFTYGRRLAQTTKQNVPIWGIAVDDVLAVGELPFRVVEDNGAGRVTVEIAGQRRIFESKEQLEQYEAAWLQALAKPGPKFEEPK